MDALIDSTLNGHDDDVNDNDNDNDNNNNNDDDDGGGGNEKNVSWILVYRKLDSDPLTK